MAVGTAVGPTIVGSLVGEAATVGSSPGVCVSTITGTGVLTVMDWPPVGKRPGPNSKAATVTTPAIKPSVPTRIKVVRVRDIVQSPKNNKRQGAKG
jgi:hypothetical protein